LKKIDAEHNECRSCARKDAENEYKENGISRYMYLVAELYNFEAEQRGNVMAIFLKRL
jgi:hypothetical protein